MQQSNNLIIKYLLKLSFSCDSNVRSVTSSAIQNSTYAHQHTTGKTESVMAQHYAHCVSRKTSPMFPTVT